MASLFPATFNPDSSPENRSLFSDFSRSDLNLAIWRLSDDPID